MSDDGTKVIASGPDFGLRSGKWTLIIGGFEVPPDDTTFKATSMGVFRNHLNINHGIDASPTYQFSNKVERTVQEEARKRAVREQYAVFRNKVELALMNGYTYQINKEMSVDEFIQHIYALPQPIDADIFTRIREVFATALQNMYAKSLLELHQRRALQVVINQINIERRNAAMPDPNAPTTLGWRGWLFDHKRGRLVSPARHTVWETPELRVENWDASNAVRGVAGIHARRMPVDWRVARWGDDDAPRSAVTGIVERFGKFVLGEVGWRAEWVFIRKLLAPDEALGLQLEQAYPDVEVHYYDAARFGPHGLLR